MNAAEDLAEAELDSRGEISLIVTRATDYFFASVGDPHGTWARPVAELPNELNLSIYFRTRGVPRQDPAAAQLRGMYDSVANHRRQVHEILTPKTMPSEDAISVGSLVLEFAAEQQAGIAALQESEYVTEEPDNWFRQTTQRHIDRTISYKEEMRSGLASWKSRELAARMAVQDESAAFA